MLSLAQKVVGVVVVAVVVIVVVSRRREPARRTSVTVPTPAATVPPAPTRVPLPTLVPATPVREPEEAASEAVSPWQEAAREPSATPTPLPTWTPRPRLTPTPTPAPAGCVDVTWSARQGTVPLGQILVDIDATNGCGRDFGPLDLWFRITGRRRGSLVQTVTAHPFETVGAGRSVSLTVGLPGSLDWYDRITVEVLGRDRN